MNYTKFQSSVFKAVAGSDVNSQVSCYGKNLTETVDGRIFVDRVETCYLSLEEAVEQIKQQKLQQDVQRDIQEELYEDMSYNTIAQIIKEHYNVKVTDTLIESYIELASSKIFTVDPVAQDIRKYNKLDRLIEDRHDYKLDDGSIIVITEDAQQRINKVFGGHSDVVEYMRESKENFLTVLDQLQE